jgi:trans-2-enoyl-CoA reductase
MNSTPRPRAAVQTEHGEPRAVVRVIDVPPETPGPGELVLRMEAAAMHLADLLAIRGQPPIRLPVPRTPGFEGVGRVLSVGDGVTGWRVGDRAFAPLASGTFREELRCAAADCLPAPEGDAVQLSLVTVNAATAAVLLDDVVRLAPGEWLVQNGANSSCGRYVVQLARSRGVRTVCVVRREEVVPELRALGADVVLVDGPDLAARVAAATGGAPIRLGLDAVAGDATQRIAECLVPDGTVACYGAISGRRCEIDFYLMFNGKRIVGIAYLTELKKRPPDAIRAMYAELAGRVGRGELVAKVAAVYPLDEIHAALEHAGRTGAERDGKVVLRIAR